MMKKYYSVLINGVYTHVKSLAQAKKLIQKQDDWEVAHYIKGDDKKLKCVGLAWKEYYDLKRKHRWDNMIGSSDKLCLALCKSRIAK
jgi:hypothetical protein